MKGVAPVAEFPAEPFPSRDEEHRGLDDERAWGPWHPRSLHGDGHALALQAQENMQKVCIDGGGGLNQYHSRDSVVTEVVRAGKVSRCDEGAVVEPAGFAGKAAAITVDQKDRRGLLG